MENGGQSPTMTQSSAEGSEQMLWDGSTSVPVPSEAGGTVLLSGKPALRGHSQGAEVQNLPAAASTPICHLRQIGYTK